ncbi:hypothetical protein Tco_0994288 [Tanacetum coccineum]
MASMNTVQKHGGSKQVGFKQLFPGVEIGVHGVHDEKHVWFCVELRELKGVMEAEVFQVSNDDTAVAQRCFGRTSNPPRRETKLLLGKGARKGISDWVEDQDGFHNEKLVHNLLKGHSILSLEGSLSGDYDVEKNGKWSCIYAVGSQEYQMVCTRLAIHLNVGPWKKEIWLKGLLAESGYELSLVAGIAIGALVKGGSRSEVPAQVEGAAYRY